MLKAKFRVNTAMICYSCQKTAVVRFIHQNRAPLDIKFVTCAACLVLPSVYQPGVSLYLRFIDIEKQFKTYSTAIEGLGFIYNCTPNIPQEFKFSISALRIKKVAKIQDPDELLHPLLGPDTSVTYLRFKAPVLNFFSAEVPDQLYKSSDSKETTPLCYSLDALPEYRQ